MARSDAADRTTPDAPDDRDPSSTLSIGTVAKLLVLAFVIHTFVIPQLGGARAALKTVSSVVSLVGTILWLRSDRKMDSRAIAQLTNPAGLAGLFNMVMDQIEQGKIPSDQLRNVQYEDFVEAPLQTVEALYRDMGVPLSDRAKQAMSAYLKAHPREARPAHRYNVGNAERHAEERKLFERYQSYFNVKTEL